MTICGRHCKDLLIWEAELGLVNLASGNLAVGKDFLEVRGLTEIAADDRHGSPIGFKREEPIDLLVPARIFEPEQAIRHDLRADLLGFPCPRERM